MSSVSNGLYLLTLPLVSVMRVIYRKIRHARYLYIKRNVEKVWGARYTLGARYLSKNTLILFRLQALLFETFYDVTKRRLRVLDIVAIVRRSQCRTLW